MLIRRAGEDEWRQPQVTTYASEAALQELLADSPSLLPGVAEGTIVVTEFPVSVGSVDLVGIDATGGIVVGECKLGRNPEIKRTVVGQLLAYAGALAEMSTDAFVRAFERRAGTPLERLFATDDGGATESPRELLSRNLSGGRFRLIVAVDAITAELRSTIGFLNEHTSDDVQVLALEIAHVRDGDIEIVVPTVYGEEAAEAKSSRRGKYGEADLLAVLEEGCSPEGYEAIGRLWAWLRENATKVNFGGTSTPSASVWVTVDNLAAALFTIYSWREVSGSLLAVNFDWLRWRSVPDERLAEIATFIRERVPAARPVLEGLEEAEFKKRPSLRIDEVLTQPGAVDAFIELVQRLGAGESLAADSSSPGP